MIDLDIKGFGSLRATHLVLDYNGTIALDGEVLPEAASRMVELAKVLEVVVLTADTHGTCTEKLAGLPCRVQRIEGPDENEAKLRAVEALGAEACIAVGNGRNDAGMLEACALGIAVLGQECAHTRVLLAADMVAGSIADALDLLLRPARMVAGLRF